MAVEISQCYLSDAKPRLRTNDESLKSASRFPPPHCGSLYCSDPILTALQAVIEFFLDHYKAVGAL